MRKSYLIRKQRIKVMAAAGEENLGFGVPLRMPKNSSEDFGGRRAEHSGSRYLYARAGYTVAVAIFVRIVHRAGATAEYNNGSDELLHGTTIIRGPGKVHGGAGCGGSGGRNKGAAVGDSPPFVPVSQSWLHRRCAHRGARGRETSPPISSRDTVHAGRYPTLPSTLAFISPTADGSAAATVRLSSTLAPAK